MLTLYRSSSFIVKALKRTRAGSGGEVGHHNIEDGRRSVSDADRQFLFGSHELHLEVGHVVRQVPSFDRVPSGRCRCHPDLEGKERRLGKWPGRIDHRRGDYREHDFVVGSDHAFCELEGRYC